MRDLPRGSPGTAVAQVHGSPGAAAAHGVFEMIWYFTWYIDRQVVIV